MQHSSTRRAKPSRWVWRVALAGLVSTALVGSGLPASAATGESTPTPTPTGTPSATPTPIATPESTPVSPSPTPTPTVTPTTVTPTAVPSIAPIPVELAPAASTTAITSVLVDGETGLPVAGVPVVSVDLEHEVDQVMARTTTAADGSFKLPKKAASDAYLFIGGTYAAPRTGSDNRYGGIRRFIRNDGILPETLLLPIGATVSGTVTESLGRALAVGSEVVAVATTTSGGPDPRPEPGYEWGSAIVDTAGRYSISGIGETDGTVARVTSGYVNLLERSTIGINDGGSEFYMGQSVQLTSASTTANLVIRSQYLHRATVSGRLMNSDGSGRPVAGVTLQLNYDWAFRSWTGVGPTTVTAADGTFTFTGVIPVKGTIGSVGGGDSRYSIGSQSLETVDPEFDENLSIGDLAIVVAGALLTSCGGCRPALVAADGTVIRGTYESLASWSPTRSGYYFSMLAPGEYTLIADYFPYDAERRSLLWWPGATDPEGAQTITVPEVTPVTANFPVTLPTFERTTITGVVREASGTPVSGATVTWRTWSGEVTATATTKSDGSYSIAKVQSTSATLTATAPGRVPASWVNPEGGAEPTRLRPSGAATSADITFASELSLAGTVTAPHGDGTLPVTGTVAVVPVAGGSAVVTTIGADGTYTFPSLAPGEYRVRVELTAPKVDTLWFGGADEAGATVLTVAKGDHLTGIDVESLAALGTLSGVVTDVRNGDPIGGAKVELYSATGWSVARTVSAADGTWTIDRVGPGAYSVKASGVAGHAPQWWSKKSTRSAADTVTVSRSSPTASGISFALVAGSTLSGRVRDESGAAVAGAVVVAYTVSGKRMQAATADASGAFVFTNLPAESYRVKLHARRQADGMYPYAFAWSSTVALGAAASASVDVTAPPAGSVTGTVTRADGTPLQYLQVEVFDANGSRVLTVRTVRSGGFTVGGLPAGEYRIRYALSDARVTGEWSGDARSFATATPITVTAGGTAVADAQLAPR